MRSEKVGKSLLRNRVFPLFGEFPFLIFAVDINCFFFLLFDWVLFNGTEAYFGFFEYFW